MVGRAWAWRRGVEGSGKRGVHGAEPAKNPDSLLDSRRQKPKRPSGGLDISVSCQLRSGAGEEC